MVILMNSLLRFTLGFIEVNRNPLRHPIYVTLPYVAARTQLPYVQVF